VPRQIIFGRKDLVTDTTRTAIPCLPTAAELDPTRAVCVSAGGRAVTGWARWRSRSARSNSVQAVPASSTLKASPEPISVALVWKMHQRWLELS
jgi:hypothetical protein